MNFFGNAPSIEIELKEEQARRRIYVERDRGEKEDLPIYEVGDDSKKTRPGSPMPS